MTFSKIFLLFPRKNVVNVVFDNALRKTSCRQFASTANRDRLDLEAICKTGVIPKTFNFARDVFEKHVVERPTATALWFDNDKSESKFTFSELKRESIRSAIALQNVLELNANSEPHTSPYILVMLPRVPEWWFLHLAAIRMGIIFCPGTTMLTPHDIQYRLEASQAKVVITDPENMWKIDEAIKMFNNTVSPSLLKKIVVSPPHSVPKNNWLNYSDLIREVNADQVTDFRDVDMDSESIAQIYFTSGTTGKPKMVAHSQVSYGIGHYKTQAIFGLKPNDVNWCIADTGWAKSAYSNFYAPWITGCTVYIHQMERFEARKVLEVLHTKPITTFCAPPTMYKSLVQVPDDNLFRFHSVRYCVGAGEAVGAEVAKVWKRKTGIRLHEAYGQTEMTAIGGWSPEREGSMGIPEKDPGYDVVIIDDDGNEVPRNTEGNIALRVKPNRPVGLFKGYMKSGPNGPEFDNEKNESCFIGDFYNTGDRAYMDNDGYVYYVGLYWSLYNHIRVASELKQGNDYSLFKKNIRPMWEDAANKRGGRWVLNLNKQQRRNELDALWLDILLCLIGESFEYSDDINGAVVNIRPRGDKISIWTADGTNQDSILSIGHKLKECLRLPLEVQISYELHKDTANKQGPKMAFTI